MAYLLFVSSLLLFSGVSTALRMHVSGRRRALPLRTGMVAGGGGLESASTLVEAILQRVEPSMAGKQFWFFFFAGSGALGIGAAQIPKILKSYDDLKALAESPLTEGGDDLLTPFGYPQAVKVKDVEKVLQNLPTVEKILEKGDKTSYMAQRGYCERSGFVNALDGCNPLAISAVYDAVSGGAGDLLAPEQVGSQLAALRADGVDAFQGMLTRSTLQKLSAYGVFAFLIALVLDLVIESGTNAFVN
jgi:hypothetical protein